MKIIHCLRAPVGGLFRHVQDLVRLQAEAGHQTGIICDASSGGEIATAALEKLEPFCALGIRRTPMSRGPGPQDVTALLAVRHMASQLKPDILHGHGAKGGAYVRMARGVARRANKSLRIFYTPHGGSLHYTPASLKGRFFLGTERRLRTKTDGIIFESAYSAKVYEEKVGRASCETRVIHNGLMPNEFYDRAIDPAATEFLFIGELRHLKGIDTLIKALGRMPSKWRVTANIIGSGPDEKQFKKLAHRMGLQHAVRFPGPMPARQGFALGQCLVVPSRSESLPYIILEAAAANVPLILTNVGGISEITDSTAMQLIEPGNVDVLHDNLVSFMSAPHHFEERAWELQTRIKSYFTAEKMAAEVIQFYDDMRGKD